MDESYAEGNNEIMDRVVEGLYAHERKVLSFSLARIPFTTQPASPFVSTHKRRVYKQNENEKL